jgi:hypothetical protein
MQDKYLTKVYSEYDRFGFFANSTSVYIQIPTQRSMKYELHLEMSHHEDNFYLYLSQYIILLKDDFSHSLEQAASSITSQLIFPHLTIIPVFLNNQDCAFIAVLQIST